ncbi:efflux RND transporter periplasmic adaptor subunit [Prosthecobacter sp.]|uniref:efflux RND transporter periplasmic adaptor subunit n=1 Tax=Prosthecobacter sp. TaxID=1965333 RepID=UPI003784EA33
MRYRDHSAMGRIFAVAARLLENRKPLITRRITASLLVGMTLASCGRQPSPPVLTRPLRRDTVVTHTYAGQIRSYRNVAIRAPESGYLEEVSVQDGRRLKEGELMFKIMPQDRTAALKRAEAQAQVAKLEYENTQHRVQAGQASEKDLATAAAKRDQKLEDLRLAQAHPGSAIITAPFSGLMGRLRLAKGSLVKKDEVLTTLHDNSQIWAEFHVPEAQYQEISASATQQVDLKMANGKMFDQTGRLVPVEKTALHHATGTVTLRALFPNPADLLRQGQAGTIRLQDTLKNALLIPQQATFEVADQRCVYVMDKDHVIHRKPVSITHELEGLFVITGGVTENDTIIISGVHRAHDGQKVANSQFEEPAVAYAHLKKE